MPHPPIPRNAEAVALFLQRYNNGEGRSLSEFAFEFHAGIEKFRRPFDDRQSEPRTANGDIACAGRIRLVKTLEDTFLLFRRNPAPRIAYANRQAGANEFHLAGHFSFGGGELDGVVDQIVEDQFQ